MYILSDHFIFKNEENCQSNLYLFMALYCGIAHGAVHCNSTSCKGQFILHIHATDVHIFLFILHLGIYTCSIYALCKTLEEALRYVLYSTEQHEEVKEIKQVSKCNWNECLVYFCGTCTVCELALWTVCADTIFLGYMWSSVESLSRTLDCEVVEWNVRHGYCSGCKKYELALTWGKLLLSESTTLCCY